MNRFGTLEDVAQSPNSVPMAYPKNHREKLLEISKIPRKSIFDENAYVKLPIDRKFPPL